MRRPESLSSIKTDSTRIDGEALLTLIFERNRPSGSPDLVRRYICTQLSVTRQEGERRTLECLTSRVLPRTGQALNRLKQLGSWQAVSDPLVETISSLEVVVREKLKAGSGFSPCMPQAMNPDHPDHPDYVDSVTLKGSCILSRDSKPIGIRCRCGVFCGLAAA